jgi:hypothetical protein
VKFPAAFLDINFVRPGVPLIQGSRPYQQIPFLFSLHKLAHICAEPEGHTFLVEAGRNVQRQFLDRFLQQTEDIKHLVVFEKSQEIKALKDIGFLFPEYQAALKTLLSKITDLSEIFRKRYFSHPGLNQYGSVRDVLPALGIPTDETDADIKSGFIAGAGFEQLFRERDIWRIQEIRELLGRFSARQAASLWALFQFMREESL